jgi:hypothetical protein
MGLEICMGLIWIMDDKWLNAPCSGVKSHPERWKEEEKG